ncbi:EpsG family protein [Alkalimarinus coralli]|uniref:EpsG family protein n=1 Tax=Alkalimarinus coralli TaxID=2935863 RepID=UPI00211191E0|nr:EpsG family protein [Alkalimarinus coralli]
MVVSFTKLDLIARKLFFWFIILLTVFIAGLRWKTGTDWNAYHDYFVMGGGLSRYLSHPHFEIGFGWLNWAANSLVGSYSIWLLIFTSTTLLIKLYTIKTRPYVLLFFMVNLAFGLADFFPTRQFLAGALSLLAIYLYSRRGPVWCLVLLLLAALIHKTVLVLLIAPIILRLTLTTVVVFAVLSGIIFGLTFFPLAHQVASFLGLEYIVSQIESYQVEYPGRVSINSIAYKGIIFTGLLYVFNSVRAQLTQYEINAVKLFLFGLVFGILVEAHSSIFNRFSFYFVIFELVAVPSVFYFCIKERVLKGYMPDVVIWCTLFCCIYLLRFFSGLMNYWELYVPYESIFEMAHKSVF